MDGGMRGGKGVFGVWGEVGRAEEKLGALGMKTVQLLLN